MGQIKIVTQLCIKINGHIRKLGFIYCDIGYQRNVAIIMNIQGKIQVMLW